MFRFALTLHPSSYDFDTDPVKRNETPDFYGYIPDEGIARPLLLVCMTLNGALLLLLRAFSAAMLMLVSKRHAREQEVLGDLPGGRHGAVFAAEGGEGGLPLLDPSRRCVWSVLELDVESGCEDGY